MILHIRVTIRISILYLFDTQYRFGIRLHTLKFYTAGIFVLCRFNDIVAQSKQEALLLQRDRATSYVTKC